MTRQGGTSFLHVSVEVRFTHGHGRHHAKLAPNVPYRIELLEMNEYGNLSLISKNWKSYVFYQQCQNMRAGNVHGWTALFGLLSSIGGITSEVEYSYDQAGRMVRVRYDQSTTIYYIYDLNGNRLQRLKETFNDGDGDGMDDAMELFHFLTTARDGSGDFDKDGKSDLEEMVARTNPADSDDYLHFYDIGAVDETKMEISWTTVPGTRYQLQFSDTLESGSWQPLGPVVTAVSITSTFIDETLSEQPTRFYRAIVIDP